MKIKYMPGLWQMVTGKMKDGETAYQTALREIKEETTLKPDKVLGCSECRFILFA